MDNRKNKFKLTIFRVAGVIALAIGFIMMFRFFSTFGDFDKMDQTLRNFMWPFPIVMGCFLLSLGFGPWGKMMSNLKNMERPKYLDGEPTSDTQDLQEDTNALDTASKKGTTYCAYCGAKMSRDAESCKNCGAKQ